jgi:dTMP kinase
MATKNPPFIVLDGLDGSGKGTQVKLLQERLVRVGRSVHFTREPGGAELSEDIRKVIKSSHGSVADVGTIFLLFWASRNEWMQKSVLPMLGKGVPVFTDRGDSSTYAYQVCAEEHLELADWCFEIRERVFGVNKPSCYIILEVSPEIARNRAISDKNREVSYFDVKPLAYYERVHGGFREFSKKAGHSHFVNGMRDSASVHEEIWAIFSTELEVSF